MLTAFSATSARVLSTAAADLGSPCKYGARTELQPGESRHSINPIAPVEIQA